MSVRLADMSCRDRHPWPCPVKLGPSRLPVLYLNALTALTALAALIALVSSPGCSPPPSSPQQSVESQRTETSLGPAFHGPGELRVMTLLGPTPGSFAAVSRYAANL